MEPVKSFTVAVIKWFDSATRAEQITREEAQQDESLIIYSAGILIRTTKDKIVLVQQDMGLDVKGVLVIPVVCVLKQTLYVVEMTND